MITNYIKEDGKIVALAERASGCWINIVPPFGAEELKSFAKDLEIEYDFLIDSLDVDERSRYEREELHRLILVNTPVLNDAANENQAVYMTVPVGIVLTADHIITISAVENPLFQVFFENRLKNFDPSNHELFLLQLFEQVVFRFLACLKKLNLKRNMIEEELYNSSRTADLKELLQIEKSLVYFVNSLSSNELLKLKMKRTDLLGIRENEDMTDLFEDVIIDNGQALEMANVHANILSSTMEAYAAIISNNLNNVIQRLTLVTIILMVPTLVASYYGMNFDWLPLKESPYGFVGVILISIMLSLILAWFFRRRELF